MKKRDVENKIREAFSPRSDLKSKVLSSCARERQEPAQAAGPTPSLWKRYYPALRRVAAGALCLLLFFSGLSLGLLIPEGGGTPTADTFVYVDVNPSIQLQTNADNRVLACVAENSDAEAILENLDLVGVDMNTALSAILGAMYVGGYLREDANSILISVDAPSEERTSSLLADITGKIDAVFADAALDCSIIAQTVEKDNAALAQRARENGVSIGKMQLIDKMIAGLSDFGEEDAEKLSAMSIRDLSLICNARPHRGEEGDPFLGDILHGEVGGYVRPSDVLALLLPELSAEQSDVDWFEIRALPKEEPGGTRMVYAVSIRLKEFGTLFEFFVDCTTGDIYYDLFS